LSCLWACFLFKSTINIWIMFLWVMMLSSLVKLLLKFQRNLSLPCSVLPWRWRQYAPPKVGNHLQDYKTLISALTYRQQVPQKCWWSPVRLHGIITHNSNFQCHKKSLYLSKNLKFLKKLDICLLLDMASQSSWPLV
jgi:hypothetical protein